MCGIMKQLWAVSCEQPQRWAERLSILASAGLNMAHTNTIADHASALGPVVNSSLFLQLLFHSAPLQEWPRFKLEIQT